MQRKRENQCNEKCTYIEYGRGREIEDLHGVDLNILKDIALDSAKPKIIKNYPGF